MQAITKSTAPVSTWSANAINLNSPIQNRQSNTPSVFQRIVKFFRGVGNARSTLSPQKSQISTPVMSACRREDSYSKLSEALKIVNEKLEAGEGSSVEKAIFLKDVAGARFKDIATAAHTMVRGADGVALPANRVQISGKSVAIATQYPTQDNIASYLSMLASNNTPVLVVLATEQEITAGRLPPYFKEGQNYGAIKVNTTLTDSAQLNDGETSICVKQYTLEIKENGKTTVIPTIHVTNWSDRNGIPASLSKQLAEYVALIKADSPHTAKQDPDALPVIHCRAGVGRTGQLIATMEILKKDSPSLIGSSRMLNHLPRSLETIIKDMRGSRNRFMVQTDTQLKALYDLAKQEGFPITKEEALRGNVRKPRVTFALTEEVKQSSINAAKTALALNRSALELSSASSLSPELTKAVASPLSTLKETVVTAVNFSKKDREHLLYQLNSLEEGLALNKYHGHFNTDRTTTGTSPSIWLSVSQPGKLAYYIPGKGAFLSEEAAVIDRAFSNYFYSQKFVEINI